MSTPPFVLDHVMSSQEIKGFGDTLPHCLPIERPDRFSLNLCNPACLGQASLGGHLVSL